MIFFRRSRFMVAVGLSFIGISFSGCDPQRFEASDSLTSLPDRREFPIDESVNPCDDLFAYSCNKVISTFELPENRSGHNFAFNDSTERLLRKKTFYLKSLEGKKSLSLRAQELSDVYQACMDPKSRAIEEKNLVESAKKLMGEISKPSEFAKLSAKNLKGDDFSLIGYFISANQDNPDIYDVGFDAGVPSLPEHSYYENPELMTDWEKLVTKFFETIGEKNANSRAKQMIAFEKEFMKTYPKPAEFREIFSSKNDISTKDLLRMYPALDLDGFVKKLPQRVRVRHLIPGSLRFLNQSMNQARLDELKSLYLYHQLAGRMDDAYPEFLEEKLKFDRKYLGSPAVRPEREERCTRYVMGAFPKEIDAELIDEVFPKFPAEKVVKLAEKIRESIIKGIQSNTWLTPSGKKNAITKIKTAELMLVKPNNDDEWDFNPTIDYSPKTPLANSSMLADALFDRDMKRVSQKRNRRRWSMGPLTVNAYYSPSNNQFVLPIGILQYPFYDPDLPEEINIGAIGTIIGHELGHAIDDKGSKYDEKGRLKPILGKQDLDQFSRRGSKFIDQFAKAGFDGRLTLGENIGDHVGLSFSYATAFPSKKGSIALKKSYYIQYARMWCYIARDKYKELQIKTNPHPLGEARINEQVKHQNGFHEAFACKKGDKLYLAPEDRIRVW